MLLQLNSSIRSQERERLFERYSGRMSVNSALTRSLLSFQGNRNRPFVSWLKYKEAFSSEFVEFVLDTFAPSRRGSILFDPFAGSGTALFAAAERGWKASGTELLPIGITVARARAAALKVNLRALSAGMGTLERVFARYPEKRPFPHLRITEDAFPEDAERELSRYRTFVAKQKDRNVRALLDFAALCVLEDVSFTRKDGQYLRWDKRSGRKLASSFKKTRIVTFRDAVQGKLREMIADIQNCDRVLKVDAVNMCHGSFLQRGFEMNVAEVDLVITSPP